MMKRAADYKKMYMKLMDASEKAIQALSTCSDEDAYTGSVKALLTLIKGQQASEEVYIESTDANLFYLHGQGEKEAAFLK